MTLKKGHNKMHTNTIKHLIIVESPAKAKTLTGFLGSDYKVLASYGHIRDLPKSTLAIDVDNNFKPDYVVSPDKRSVIAELKRYISKDTTIYLASDEDREGEAISWHLIPTLGIQNHNPKRIVFHEITKSAILHALEHPRELDVNMVNAQQARRILDRIVGYKLSPLLWKKVKGGLSAGRVQSSTLKIVVDREREIKSFIPDEFWKLRLDILTDPTFRAEFSKHNGKVIKVENESQATAIKSECDKSNYVLSNIDEKDSFRNPPPPFTTSSLQQEASIKAGMSPKQTMSVAQKLYEGGLSIPGHPEGLITYMRTDSLNLSQLVLDACKQVILSEYGQQYALSSPRSYSAKGKGKVAAQEAHEAIRPIDMSIKPSDIARYVDDKELKLYTLIWQRTLATQMTQAKVATTTYKIYGGSNKEYEFVAKGTKILFPGFMKAYTEGNDNGDENISKKEKFLPNVPLNTVFNNTVLTTEQNFTTPPARYTEASLVKKMEQEGIGRPSTYASTLSTITSRGYVEIDADKKLVPTVIAMAVTDYLTTNFPYIVDLTFTANIESEFDKIAAGEVEWQDVIRNFYTNFSKDLLGKEDGDRVQYTEERVLGVDAATGLDIKVKSGNYGNYIQVGDSDKEKKIKAKVAAVPKDIKFNEVTLEQALVYLTIPKILGKTDKGDDIVVGIGKFGGYLKAGDKYYSINKELDDIYTIELTRALDIIKEIDKTVASSTLWSNKDGTLKVMAGKYSIYLSDKRTKGKKINSKLKIPSNISINKDSLEIDILSYITQNGEKNGAYRRQSGRISK
jgi:DNA topoisomerase I